MKLVPFLFLFSLFLVSCGSDKIEPRAQVLSPSELGKSCKVNSDCGFSEKCVGGRCYGI